MMRPWRWLSRNGLLQSHQPNGERTVADSLTETRCYHRNTVPDESLHDVQLTKKLRNSSPYNKLLTVSLLKHPVYILVLIPLFLGGGLQRHAHSTHLLPAKWSSSEYGRSAFLHIREHVAGIPFFAISDQYLIKISNTKWLKKKSRKRKKGESGSVTTITSYEPSDCS
jgi:hypothetical protein